MSAGTSEFFCLICFLVCSCTAQEIITAERGQDVILPCKAPDIKDINDITAVAWIRPDQDPDYVLVYRDGHFDPDSQHPSYQNRVDLQDEEMKDGDFSLILKKVKTEDRGTYECLVDQSGKTELISIINLEVYDYSRTTLGIVGFVVGVLVCPLSAAAVYLFQNRKEKKTLERTNQHLERNHSETNNQLLEKKQKNEILEYELEECKDENLKSMKTEKKLKTVVQNKIQELKKMNCCTNSNPTGSFKENPEKERMKTGRKLKAVVQNKIQELNRCTNSDPTESDEENEQEERMKTGRKLKAVVQNKIQELNCFTTSDLTESDEKNPQEEDEKLQEENQKLMETGRNLQTEPQNMDQKLEVEESITVVDVHERGDVICPQNISSEEIELEGWKLELQRNNREPDIYHLRRQ